MECCILSWRERRHGRSCTLYSELQGSTIIPKERVRSVDNYIFHSLQHLYSTSSRRLHSYRANAHIVLTVEIVEYYRRSYINCHNTITIYRLTLSLHLFEAECYCVWFLKDSCHHRHLSDHCRVFHLKSVCPFQCLLVLALYLLTTWLVLILKVTLSRMFMSLVKSSPYQREIYKFLNLWGDLMLLTYELRLQLL